MIEPEMQKEETRKPRTPKLSAEKALPQSGAEMLVKIIKAYAVASNGGETQVNYKDVASAANLSPTIVSANNRFLAESQFLSSPRYGFYVPTEGAVKFARESAWDEKEAKTHLRKIVAGTWFGQVAVQNLTLRSNISRDDLKKSMAIKCGATEGDSNALDFLIDFVGYTGLVESGENETLTKGNFDEVEKPLIPASAPSSVPDSSIIIAGEEPLMLEASKPSQVSLVIHVHISSFEDLTPDHAARLREWIQSLKGASDRLEVQTELTPNQEDRT